jgi:hypothetical protein
MAELTAEPNGYTWTVEESNCGHCGMMISRVVLANDHAVSAAWQHDRRGTTECDPTDLRGWDLAHGRDKTGSEDPAPTTSDDPTS